MTPESRQPYGEEPDDLGDERAGRGWRGAHGDAGDAAHAGELDGEESLFLGWPPPENRAWRHPSELSSLAPAAGGRAGFGPGGAAWGSTAGTSGSGTGTFHSVAGRRRTAAMALVGTGAAAAALAGIVLLNTAGSGDGTGGPAFTYPSTVALSTAPSAETVPEAARGVENSLVWVTVTTVHGVTSGCGVVVGKRGMVATSAAAVGRATSVVVTTADGAAVPAKVVAVDGRVGVALLRVGRDLPVPRFDDDTSVAVGRSAMVMTAAAHTAAPAVAWAPATIASVGTAVGASTAGSMAEIGVAVSDRVAVPGSVLVEDGRGVIGIMAAGGATGATSGTGTTTWRFVPVPLLLGVTSDLQRWGRVHHGWLNVTADDAAAPTGQTGTVGALVVKVDPGGVAKRSLQPGDVIVAIAGSPVRSMAELRARLYVLSAGEPVSVAVRRGGVPMTTEIALAASP